MRIGIDASFLREEVRYSGMGSYTAGLVRGLAAVNHTHELVLLGYGERPSTAPERLPWYAIDRFPAGKASAWLSHQVTLPRLAARLHLDLLHVTGVNVRLSQPGVPFALPCRLVVTVHDAIPYTYYGVAGPQLPWRLRLGFRVAMTAARRAGAVITVSETSRRDISAALPIPRHRIAVVYNGLDALPEISPEAAAEILARLGVKPPFLLYVGSYEPRKNLLGAVRGYRLAAGQRPLPPLVAVVERESGHRAAAQRAIEAEGGADVRLLHSLTRRELAALYRYSSLFLYPSHYEGFGFNPLEALSCGTPVIAARTGSLPEVLGDAATYVSPDSPAEMAAAIHAHLDCSRLARLAAERGPARAARYTWHRAALETLDVYGSALAQRR